MVSLPLELALTVLTLCGALMAVQLIILTVEIARLRRDVLLLLRTITALNHAVNPWAGEDETTEPDPRRPPRVRRRARWSWFLATPNRKRQHPE